MGMALDSLRMLHPHHGKSWPPSQLKYLRKMFKKGIDLMEMSEILGRSRNSMLCQLFQMGEVGVIPESEGFGMYSTFTVEGHRYASWQDLQAP